MPFPSDVLMSIRKVMNKTGTEKLAIKKTFHPGIVVLECSRGFRVDEGKSTQM